MLRLEASEVCITIDIQEHLITGVSNVSPQECVLCAANVRHQLVQLLVVFGCLAIAGCTSEDPVVEAKALLVRVQEAILMCQANSNKCDIGKLSGQLFSHRDPISCS